MATENRIEGVRPFVSPDAERPVDAGQQVLTDLRAQLEVARERLDRGDTPSPYAELRVDIGAVDDQSAGQICDAVERFRRSAEANRIQITGRGFDIIDQDVRLRAEFDLDLVGKGSSKTSPTTIPAETPTDGRTGAVSQAVLLKQVEDKEKSAAHSGDSVSVVSAASEQARQAGALQFARKHEEIMHDLYVAHAGGPENYEMLGLMRWPMTTWVENLEAADGKISFDLKIKYDPRPDDPTQIRVEVNDPGQLADLAQCIKDAS